MEEKKPSTADILAKIRAQKAAAASADASAPVAEQPAPVEAPIAAAETAPPVAPAAKPAAAASSKPTSTKDIMAAIRSGGGKPTASATAPSVATPVAGDSPAAATPIAAAKSPAGPRPSVQEMLKNLREGKASGAAAAIPAQPAAAKPASPVAAPPMPAKPVPAGKSGKPSAVARGMAGLTTVAMISATCLLLGYVAGSGLLVWTGILAWTLLMSPFAAAWTAIGGISAIWTLGTARFMFPNVLVEPPSKFKVGPASDYPINTVSNKWKDQFGIWIVHTDQYEGRNLIFTLASVCTHLGCTPNWLDGEQKFKCPCHGSGFYITGVNFEGPAPRPLERVGLRIAEDGMLEVNKSMKFQEEMGQWVDPTSYVEIA